ncbi:MAG: thioredoxin family protein [Patescibacteria group bacterium]
MNKIILEILSSPGCYHCAEFKKYWESVKAQFPEVEMVEIDLISDKGQEMVQKYMIMASPGVIINGELFAVGGVNKEKFEAKLKELSVSDKGRN